VFSRFAAIGFPTTQEEAWKHTSVAAIGQDPFHAGWLCARSTAGRCAYTRQLWANDVKCGHGSTIGRLDEEALFYLRSRGLGLEQARSLLTYAFASEMLSQITIAPMQAALHETLHTWLSPQQRG
jgi:hypothetical protein